MKRLQQLSVLMIFAALTLSGCLKKQFDNPPDLSGYDPQLPVTHSIAALKNMNGAYNRTTGGDTSIITTDVVISGIVTGDDRSGNLYKQITIQDTSGAIMVLINAYSLYNDYPVGRKVYIKCKGLWLGYDGGLPVLGGSVSEQLAINGISGSQIGDHIVKANVGNPVISDTLSFTQAMAAGSNPKYYNKLITIKDVEFNDTSLTFTQPNATTNRYMVECYDPANTATSKMFVVRTSNYANFAAVRLPSGKGYISGIFTVYVSSTVTPQLLVRSLNDVQLTGTRCDGTPPPTNAPLITIDSLRKLYPGTGTFTLPLAKITGVVISDVDNGNSASGNFILQDGSGKGVIMYIAGSSAYKLGDSLTVDVSAASLKLYSGALELDGVTVSKVTKNASGKSVTPTVLTIAQLNANFTAYESTLVRIANATIAAGGTYSGNKTMTDASSGTMILYTASGASFATQTVATTPKTYTGIVTPFNTTKEIKMRNINDVQ